MCGCCWCWAMQSSVAIHGGIELKTYTCIKKETVHEIVILSKARNLTNVRSIYSTTHVHVL